MISEARGCVFNRVDNRRECSEQLAYQENNREARRVDGRANQYLARL